MEYSKSSLVRITTRDSIELQGVLTEPRRRSRKAIIHVHGWVGNFHENKFIDSISEKVVAAGCAFFAFNNRGAGIVTDFIKRRARAVNYIRIGGSIEKFEDCVLDIEAAIDYLNRRGFKEIILQGHSLGCQKIIYYWHRIKDKRVKKLILLAPVDDVDYVKRKLGRRYQSSLLMARQRHRVESKAALPGHMEFYPLMTAAKFLDVGDPDSTAGGLLDRKGEMREVASVRLPLLAVFGSRDEYEARPELCLKNLAGKNEQCRTRLIRNAGHGFAGYERELATIVASWLN